MKSQVELAREHVVTEQMKHVAAAEGFDAETIRERVALGEIVIPNNPTRAHQKVVGIGRGLRTKVNASIGTSSDICDLDLEVRKAQIAEEEQADTLMELSAGGDLDKVRRTVLENCSLPVGNVPLYQAFCESARKYRDPDKLDPEFLFELIERQLNDGISFMAVHCGINQYTTERLRRQGYRYGGLVSKGGTYMVSWMDRNKKENPLFEQFDRVCALFKKYDAVLSLGNGIRAGAIHDSHDRAQMAEMIINCEANCGSFLTRNGGKSWELIHFPFENSTYAFDPSNPEIMYSGANVLLHATLALAGGKGSGPPAGLPVGDGIVGQAPYFGAVRADEVDGLGQEVEIFPGFLVPCGQHDFLNAADAARIRRDQIQ